MTQENHNLSNYDLVDVIGDGLCGYRSFILSLLYQGLFDDSSLSLENSLSSDSQELESKDEENNQLNDNKNKNRVSKLFQAYQLIHNEDKPSYNEKDFSNELTNLKENYDPKVQNDFLEKCVFALIYLLVSSYKESSFVYIGSLIFDYGYSGYSIDYKDSVLFSDRSLRSRIIGVARYLHANNVVLNDVLKDALLYKILSGRWNYHYPAEMNVTPINSQERFFELLNDGSNCSQKIKDYLTKVFQDSERYKNKQTPFFVALWKRKFETAQRGLIKNALRNDHYKRFATQEDFQFLKKKLNISHVRTLTVDSPSQPNNNNSVAIYQTEETPLWRWLISWPEEHFEALKPQDNARSQDTTCLSMRKRAYALVYNRVTPKIILFVLYCITSGIFSTINHPITGKIDEMLFKNVSSKFGSGALSGALIMVSLGTIIYVLKKLSAHVKYQASSMEFYDFDKKKIVLVTRQRLLILFAALCLPAALGTCAAALNGKIDLLSNTMSSALFGLTCGLLIAISYAIYMRKQYTQMPKKTLGLRALGIIGACVSIGLLSTHSHWIESFNPIALEKLTALQQGAIIGAELTLAVTFLPTLFFFAYWAHSAYIHKLEKEEEKNYLCVKDNFNSNILNA